MNKLYILGALALTQVDAYWSGASVFSTTNVATVSTFTGAGSYTYTMSGDCLASSTATTNGMFNTYHQYYSFTMTAGTSIFTAASSTIPILSTYAYTGCWHQHLYNWMAQPMLTTAAVTSGFGNAVNGYGYTMTGASLAACTTSTPTTGAVSGTLTNVAKTTFTGAQYQSLTSIFSPVPALTATATSVSLAVSVGPSILGTTLASVSTFIATIPSPTGNTGFAITTTANTYWDFMQNNVIQGQTLYGRGGGSTTAPCGWYVFYAYELPTPGQVAATNNNVNTVVTGTGITVNMWTDNAIIKSASAFALTAIAGLLF